MQEVQLPHYRLQRNKNGAKAERKKRGGFARKPAPFLATFSRAFVSRLRHRAGIVRRGTRREEVQNGPFRNLKPRFLTGRTREQGVFAHVRVFAGKTDF